LEIFTTETLSHGAFIRCVFGTQWLIPSMAPSTPDGEIIHFLLDNNFRSHFCDSRDNWHQVCKEPSQNILGELLLVLQGYIRHIDEVENLSREVLSSGYRLEQVGQVVARYRYSESSMQEDHYFDKQEEHKISSY